MIRWSANFGQCGFHWSRSLHSIYIMYTEWKQSSTVREGGRVEVTVPSLHTGEVVEVLVRVGTNAPPTKERPLGLLKGKIKISEDFDARKLDGYEEYTR